MNPTSINPSDFQKEFIHRTAWKAGVLGALNLATQILAIRFVVLTAIVGGISLTWLALGQPDPYRLGALAIYCGFVVLPTVWLAAAAR
jgi:hypothetical protein